MVARIVIAVCLVIFCAATCFTQQLADPHFVPKVANPAFTKNYPRVLFDEAHNNSETTGGRYKAFADLLFNDGYHPVVNRQPFTKASLSTYKILIIVNPLGSEDVDEEGAESPAFTSEECDAVNEWVRGGGALLFVVDNGPFASAAEVLAQKFAIEMSKGETNDPANAAADFKSTAVITYSRENHLLPEHSINNGRSDAERVSHVIVFGGQSLKGPAGSEVFLKLADTAVDKITLTGKTSSAVGRAQGIALRVGKGRVVALGDAAMLSAQLLGSQKLPFGMNAPDVDNLQLALNIMHWLSGLLK